MSKSISKTEAAEQDDAELFKLDAWIEDYEAKSRTARIQRYDDVATYLELLVKQAHVYAGKLRTLRAQRAEERNAI